MESFVCKIDDVDVGIFLLQFAIVVVVVVSLWTFCFGGEFDECYLFIEKKNENIRKTKTKNIKAIIMINNNKYK